MNARALSLCSILWSGLFVGCGSSPDALSPEAAVEKLRTPTGEKRYHEWKEIWVGENPAQKRKVGFLDRVFTESDSEGITIVKDLLTSERGFLLPTGRALLIESDQGASRKLRDLGFLSLEDTVRKALGVSGWLEFRTDLSASTSPKAKLDAEGSKTESETPTAAAPAKTSLQSPAPSSLPKFKGL